MQMLFSDIDLRVLLAEKADKPQFLRLFLSNLTGVSFVETQAENYAVVHFDSFVKLDIFVYTDLLPSSRLKNIKILQDDGRLAHVKAASQNLTFLPTQDEFDNLLNKLYGWTHELYRRYQRGEKHYSEKCRLMLKNILVAFWYIEMGAEPNAVDDWSKYEGSRSKLSATQLAFLAQEYEIPEQVAKIRIAAESAAIDISMIYHLRFDKMKFTEIMGKVF